MAKITEQILSLSHDATYTSFEFFPPKTPMGFSNLRDRIERMAKGLNPLFVCVTWGAGGSTSAKSLQLAELCQRQIGLTTCLHLTCTNTKRSVIEEALEDAKALGIRNILALRGDAPREEYCDESEERIDQEASFVWAIDLVRFIKQKYGNYFCVGVAAYPEGHADTSYPERQDPAIDLPYLVEKVKAGANFIMTQLFYDPHVFLRLEKMLREHESGVFRTMPIIPGLMPVQGYQILKRTAKLSHAIIPSEVSNWLEAMKHDDGLVKEEGIKVLSQIITTIKRTPSSQPRGFHFYTLNLEKSVARIIERCQLVPSTRDTKLAQSLASCAIDEESDDFVFINHSRSKRRQTSSSSSAHQNRLIVDHPPSAGSRTASFSVASDQTNLAAANPPTKADSIAISEGEGSLGREATWDDYPNGRFGDGRSPAFNAPVTYSTHPLPSPAEALALWRTPTSQADITQLFQSHVSGTLAALPWSEDGLNEETALIRPQLAALIAQRCWTIASQPAVNGLPSSHVPLGWGPKGGFVFQKSFVEFFVPTEVFRATLLPKLQAASEDEVTFYAASAAGEFVSNAPAEAVNAVTWGVFTGKEIVTPTMIEAGAFREWAEEAFELWRGWACLYHRHPETQRFLYDMGRSCWLVNVTHHEFIQEDALWEFLKF